MNLSLITPWARVWVLWVRRGNRTRTAIRMERRGNFLIIKVEVPSTPPGKAVDNLQDQLFIGGARLCGQVSTKGFKGRQEHISLPALFKQLAHQVLQPGTWVGRGQSGL